MDAREISAEPASTVTLTLSREALGALDDYLRSGAARGLAFEWALREAVGAGGPAPGTHPAARRCPLAPRTLRQVQAFVQSNLTRDFRIEDIARAAFLSPHHLGHGYREATGQSLWQYVLVSRARLAHRLIAAEPQVSLADIAEQAGFGCYGQFIAVFRKAFGVTPGQYRRGL